MRSFKVGENFDRFHDIVTFLHSEHPLLFSSLRLSSLLLPFNGFLTHSPACVHISANSKQLKGASSDGFRIMQQPAARAGTTWKNLRIISDNIHRKNITEE